MGVRLGREQEVGAARQNGFAERLAGEQIVAEIDGAQILHARAMRRKPALGGIALAILFFGPVRLDDELGHQRHDHVVAGRDDGRRQHRVVKLGLAIRTLARLTMRTAEFLRAKIFGSVEGDQRASAKPFERRHPALRPQYRNHLIERGLQMRGMDGIEHRTNVIVRRNFRHAEQSMAIGGLASFFERTLIGEKRLRLHEEQ